MVRRARLQSVGDTWMPPPSLLYYRKRKCHANKSRTDHKTRRRTEQRCADEREHETQGMSTDAFYTSPGVVSRAQRKPRLYADLQQSYRSKHQEMPTSLPCSRSGPQRDNDSNTTAKVSSGATSSVTDNVAEERATTLHLLLLCEVVVLGGRTLLSTRVSGHR
jgi:hypothetical protein